MRHDPTDLELVDRVRRGDYGAFEVLVRRYERMVFRLARGMMHNDRDAEEVVQDAFLNAFRRLESFRGESAFSSWLYRVAANAALMRLRSARRTDARIAGPLNGDESRSLYPASDWSKQAEAKLLDKELGHEIDQAIAALPEKYRLVLLLHDVEGLDNKEIQDILSLSAPTLKTRLHRARLAVRERLNRYFEGRPAESEPMPARGRHHAM